VTFSKTRILLFLSFALAIGVAIFVFGPSLYPRADARESGSTVEGNASCNATFTGIIMHRFEDGSVLFRFGEGHKVRVAPPSDDFPRNAVLLYKDGTARVQDFEPGTEVRRMPRAVPTSDEWYDPQGKPREAPPAGDYVELWPKIAEEFFPEGTDFPELDPPGRFWNDPGYAPPIEIDEAISRWGHPVDSYQGTDFQCVVFANGIEWCDPYEEGDPSLVYYPDGTLDIVYSPDRVQRIRPYDPSENSMPRQTVTTYGDGTKVIREYPSRTRLQDIDSTEPLKVQWFDPQGNLRVAPAPDEYPVDKIGKVPPRMREYPFAEGSWDHPFEQDPIFPPPRTLREREDLFGPRTNEYEDEWHIWEEYADGTKYRYDRETGWIRIITPDYNFYEWGNEPPFFRSTERPAVLPGCDVRGPFDYTQWKDGTSRVRIYPNGTSTRQMKDTRPVCEEWRDGQGNARQPGSAENYPEPPRDGEVDPPRWNLVSQ
jgi:hypothetical protein